MGREYSNIEAEIIDFIIRNRVSTTEVADALGKTGVIEGVQPITRGMHKVGRVKWIYANAESNWMIHEQIQNIEENTVVLFEQFHCGKRALFGELVSKYLLLYKQCIALVVCGNLRDAAGLIKNNYPVWCEGFNPVGCFNSEVEKDIDESLKKERREQYDGAIAICDDCGVVLIPKNQITKGMLQKLQAIEEQEDIWFDRLDHFKESTYEIVCKKTYQNQKEYLENRKLWN